MEHNYHDQVNIDNALRLREITAALPRFCQDFFRGIEPTTTSKTRIAYAYDLTVFFDFLKTSNPVFKEMDIRSMNIELLDQLKSIDIEEYLEYLKYYIKDGKEHVNDKSGQKRKLITLRSFYNYYFKKEMIQSNPPSLINIPKLNEKEIIRLDIDEVAKLLDAVEFGDTLTNSQRKYHEKTKLRDLALMTLLLGTGIRVSECVGLDIDHVDFNNSGIKIKRKGGNEVIIYFGDEVYDALENYIEERKKMPTAEGHANALFLSMQKKRLTVKSVENIVNKYTRTVTKLKNITPHKLRSTYGTSLYQETGDIYLVADVLGHTDVNTTKKHYAAIGDARRRSASKAVRLRGE